MKNAVVVLFAMCFFLAFGAQAAGSFRLDSGSLISTGQSKSEVLVLAGEPLYQDDAGR